MSTEIRNFPKHFSEVMGLNGGTLASSSLAARALPRLYSAHYVVRLNIDFRNILVITCKLYVNLHVITRLSVVA